MSDLIQANAIAIDGPGSSGKTTLGLHLANCLGYLFFDTGVMYRAVAWAALENHVDISDEASVTRLAENLQIEVQAPSVQDGRWNDVLVNGRDVTWEIRHPEVEAEVSAVSAYPGVRRALTAVQRKVGLRGRVVMVGRDIGTVVLPEADIKIYLDASVEERAHRRFLELCERGENVPYEVILKSLRKRDRIDSTRRVAPLKPAQDAMIVNSDGLDAEQVFMKVKRLLQICQA